MRHARDRTPAARFAMGIALLAVMGVPIATPAFAAEVAADGPDDTEPPVATAVVHTTEPDSWHRSAVPVSITATDSGSGVRAITATDTLTGRTYTAAVGDLALDILVDTDGAHRLVFGAVDAAGNASGMQEVTVRVDGGEPVIDMRSAVDGAVVEQHSVVPLDYSCVDAVSGIERCEGPGDLLPTRFQGSHSFTINAVDNSGNTALRSFSYTVVPAAESGTGPHVDATTSPAPPPSGWFADSVGVRIAAADPDGVNSVFWRIDMGEVQATEEDAIEFEIVDEGETVIDYWAYDLAGDASETGRLVVRIDRTAPELTVVGPSGTNGALPTVRVGDRVELAGDCRDAGSGVAWCARTATGGTVLDTSTPGDRSVRVSAGDAAGNTTLVDFAYRVEPAAAVTAPEVPAAPAGVEHASQTVDGGRERTLAATGWDAGPVAVLAATAALVGALFLLARRRPA